MKYINRNWIKLTQKSKTEEDHRKRRALKVLLNKNFPKRNQKAHHHPKPTTSPTFSLRGHVLISIVAVVDRNTAMSNSLKSPLKSEKVSTNETKVTTAVKTWARVVAGWVMACIALKSLKRGTKRLLQAEFVHQTKIELPGSQLKMYLEAKWWSKEVRRSFTETVLLGSLPPRRSKLQC